MRILIVLIPISLVLLGVAIGAFIWAVRRGQFDDLETPAIAVLADDDLQPGRARSEPSARNGQPPPAA
jgi:cbb3-type cytochrome oxidase maturation protein